MAIERKPTIARILAEAPLLTITGPVVFDVPDTAAFLEGIPEEARHDQVRRILELGIQVNGVVTTSSTLQMVEAQISGMTQELTAKLAAALVKDRETSMKLVRELLDDLDQLLDSRGHRFCRYADDCNIYVRSLAAGQRVMESVTRFLEEKLKLRVNREKSAVAPVGERKFLGHRLLLNGKLGIAPKSVARAKEKIRQITSRTRGVNLVQVIVELNLFLVGWLAYYRFAAFRGELTRMDEWIRRRLRCYRLK